jgi:hypothetical protein
MAEVSMGGLNIKWSSLSKQDKKEYGAGMALLTIASGISGVILGGIWGERILGEVNTLEWLYPYLYPVAIICFFLSIKLMTNFMERQDEGFVDFNTKAAMWGVNFFWIVGFLVAWPLEVFMGFDFVFFEYFLLYSLGISIGARKAYKQMYVIDINEEQS